MTMALELILAHNNGKGLLTEDLYTQDTLRLDQDYSLFAQIDNEVMGEKGAKQVCKPKPLPPGFQVKRLDEENGWKTEKEDMYGRELTYVLAKELCKVKQEDDWTDWNRAIFAMMKALPPDFPIILWWT